MYIDLNIMLCSNMLIAFSVLPFYWNRRRCFCMYWGNNLTSCFSPPVCENHSTLAWSERGTHSSNVLLLSTAYTSLSSALCHCSSVHKHTEGSEATNKGKGLLWPFINQTTTHLTTNQKYSLHDNVLCRSSKMLLHIHAHRHHIFSLHTRTINLQPIAQLDSVAMANILPPESSAEMGDREAKE